MRPAPHLLIVDDEPSVLLTLGMIFEQDGYRVTRAASCAEALRELANGHLFDAIITDLNMEAPDIGLDVARAALRLRPRPAVVVCTGYADIKNARAALQMRVDYSCWICGNPRRLEGRITIQEERQLQAAREEMEPPGKTLEGEKAS